MTDGALGPMTLAAIPAVEQRGREVLLAAVSAIEEAASGALAGAVLLPPHGAGEAATRLAEGGRLVVEAPLRLLAVLEVPPGRSASLARAVAVAASRAARCRRAAVAVTAVTRVELPHLPPSVLLAEAACGSLLRGPASLLAPLARLDASRIPPGETLRLLVRAGALLVAAHRALDEAASGPAALADAGADVASADLLVASAVLVSAGRFVAGTRARAAALRSLGSGGASGCHLRMSWTQLHEVKERHAAALASREAEPAPAPLGEARRDAARAADSWLCVLRLSEEERLGAPLLDWSAYLAALAARRGEGGSRSLFPGLFPGPPDGLPTRRALRGWPAAERVAPALATLLDWDPGHRALAPLLLDLPENASRRSLAARAAALAATA